MLLSILYLSYSFHFQLFIINLVVIVINKFPFNHSLLILISFTIINILMIFFFTTIIQFWLHFSCSFFHFVGLSCVVITCHPSFMCFINSFNYISKLFPQYPISNCLIFFLVLFVVVNGWILLRYLFSRLCFNLLVFASVGWILSVGDWLV